MFLAVKNCRFSMKEIRLTQGQVALVDDADYDWLNQWKWYAHKNPKSNSFYAVRNVYESGRHLSVKMHRLILGLTDPKIFCDHENGNGLDNQRHNIRVSTYQENMRNKPSYKNGTSRFKGVSFKAQHKKWVAQIQVDGKKVVHIGYFSDEESAAVAYNKAAIKHYGEFARLNTVAQ